MTILSVDSLYKDENGVIHVSAIVEDVIQTYSQTLYDPAEYGPGLCEASFELEEDEELPDNEHELIQFLENLDLEWILIYDNDY